MGSLQRTQTPKASLYTLKGVLYLVGSNFMLMDRSVAQIQHQKDVHIIPFNSIGEHN